MRLLGDFAMVFFLFMSFHRKRKFLYYNLVVFILIFCILNIIIYIFSKYKID
jgi:uncharacterized membrane protein YdbT with pleckstrin-like domain